MVAGAVGFVATLLLWGDRVGCLLVSTLITFTGLGFIVAKRRYDQEGDGNNSSAIDDDEESLSRAAQEQPGFYQAQATVKDTPPGSGQLEEDSLPGGLPDQTVATPPADPLRLSQPDVIGEPPVLKPGLLEQVMTALRTTGAAAKVENRRHGRVILKITGSDGQKYTALVHENLYPVEISEIRSLQALVNNSASAGGFLFSSAPFTPEAYEWAGARKIRLVMTDELGEISL